MVPSDSLSVFFSSAVKNFTVHTNLDLIVLVLVLVEDLDLQISI